MSVATSSLPGSELDRALQTEHGALQKTAPAPAKKLNPPWEILQEDEMRMVDKNRGHTACPDKGFSLVELLIVVVIAGVLTAIAIPQITAQRRLMRSHGVIREIATQMRYARQLAMSERKAFTFSYLHNSGNRQITIIDHNNDTTDPNSGKAVLTAAGYPNTAGSTVVSTVRLDQGGLVISEIAYGIPTGLPTVALGDLTTMTALGGSRLNITFQRDGSVIASTGTVWDRNPQNKAMFIYNTNAPAGTAAAVSVLGASGRIKIWRYDNVSKYAE